jgi:nitrogen fixation NifU-like protein
MSADLYEKRLLKLARDEEHVGRLTSLQATATVDNPLCGDVVTIDLAIEAGRISKIGTVVRGCILCAASAAALSRQAVGLDATELRAAAASLQAMLADEVAAPEGDWRDLAVFTPVAGHKSRHRCVTLPFEAACKALENAGD